MKNIINLCFSLLICVLISCRDQITDYPESQDIPAIKFSKIVQINDSTTIYFKIQELVTAKSRFSYLTRRGRIKQKSDKLEYFAPAIQGVDQVKLEIINSDSTMLSDSINILIYKQLIFLKADDLINDYSTGISKNWLRFTEYIKSKNIRASLGLIGNSLELKDGVSDIKNRLYLGFLNDIANTDNFEIFNHGYDHNIDIIDESGKIYDEFKNRSTAYQYDHLMKTQNLLKEKIGVIIHTFGAPGNAIDDSTIKALNEVPEIKIWYYGFSDPNKLILKRKCEIEFPAHSPDYQKFINNYDSTQAYLAFQIHPNNWNENQFNEFEKIIDFLISKEVIFENPYKYYLLISGNN